MCQYKRTSSHSLFTTSHNLFHALASALLSIHPVFRLQVFWFECLLRENALAIMTMTTFKVSTAALRLLAIACILLVVVQVTEAARELDDGVGGVLVMNREQVASVHTKAELTVFQAAACELLRLPCAVQSSNGVTSCGSPGAYCFWPQDCCSRTCNYNGMLPPTCG
jgi:hypothetical protein